MTFQSRAIQLAELICAITTVSSGRSHSTLNETSFENQEVSTTNVVGGYMKGCVGGRQRSFSFLSFFAFRERPLVAENGSGLCGTRDPPVRNRGKENGVIWLTTDSR